MTVNLCTNPSFETNLNGWADQGTVTRTRVTTAARDGVASMRIQATNRTFAGAHFDFTPAVGSHWFSFYIKGTAGDEVRLVITNSVTTTEFDTFPLATSGWERLSLDANVASTDTLQCFLDTGSNAQTVDWLIDAVLIEQSATLSPYPFPDSGGARRIRQQFQLRPY